MARKTKKQMVEERAAKEAAALENIKALENTVGQVVFKSADKTGDWAGMLLFYDGKTGTRFGSKYYFIRDPEGMADWYSAAEINIDPATIRPYNCETDGDFYGTCGI